LELGLGTIVIKLGVNGCLVATKKEVFETKSFNVDVVDATGAGDAFDAAFLAGILEGGITAGARSSRMLWAH